MKFPAVIQKAIDAKKDILVYGLGKSGVAAITALKKCSVSVIGADSATEKTLHDSYPDRLELLRNLSVSIYFEDAIPNFDSIGAAIISPGVPFTANAISSLREKNIPLIGEFELGIEWCNLPSIIITGSNGKSTTTALIGDILNASDIPVSVCGNIGTPIVEVLEDSKGKKGLIVEASSYQLEESVRIKPAIAMVLNISENHLERHGTIENYIEAKLKIFQNQTKEDFSILNGDDTQLMEYREKALGTLCLFGQNRKVFEAGHWAKIDYDPSIQLDEITVHTHGQKETFVLKPSLLVGLHNRYNWAAAILGAKLFGASAEAIRKTIETFVGLPHRLEVISKIGPLVINDSKSTTAASTISAIDSIRRAYPARKIHLLIGGKKKKGSWDELSTLLKNTEGEIVTYCFGGDGELLVKIFKEDGLKPVAFPTLKPAVQEALNRAGKDDIILLSPACVSFDEFLNFEERGDFFRDLVARSL